MKTFVADFETTTFQDDCRVWAFALCEVDNIDNKIFGNNIDDFMEWCAHKRENYKVLFHRLEFDGQFIISWLYKNGFVYTTDQNQRQSKTFNTLISNKGIYYQIEVIFERKNKSINKVVFQNSFNLIPLSVKKIARAFKLPISKLEIDYDEEREIGHKLTEEEKAYISNDVEIVARAVKFFYEQGLNKMTIGSCALAEYKKTITENKFKLYYPPPTYDRDIRQSYRGGYTYLEPEFENKVLGNGVVLDINSTHPYTMYSCELPYGTPLHFKGKYKQDEMYPLYVQMIRCQFELKDGYIPTVQIRYGTDFNASEYLSSSNDLDVVLCLTNIDLEIFFEHYEVYNVEYFGGWKFKSAVGLFKEYVEKWSNIKIEAKKEENWGLYTIAKYMLNSLYGKFGTLPQVKSKIPYLDEQGVVCYKDGATEVIDGVYLATASFITSYSRQRIINAIQKVKDDYNKGKSNIRFVYADTDSLHCLSEDFSIPEGLDIDDTELGKFKVEAIFRKAKFLRQKCYIEEMKEPSEDEFRMKITVAGMPEACYESVTFENFKIGTTYKGSLKPIRVPGGVILGDVDYTLKEG